MGREAKGTLLVLSAAAIWGSSFVVIKLGLEGAPPVTSSLLRFALAALASGLVLRRLGPLSRAALTDPLVVGLALLNAVGFVLQYLGLAQTNSAVAALLANIGVVVVAALSAVYLHERIGAKTAAAVVLAFAGGSLLATRGDLSNLGGTEFQAALMIAVASVLWSVYVVLNKLTLQRTPHSEEEIAWAVLALTALLTLPPALLWEGFPSLAYSPQTWASILYAALACSSLSYVIYMKGLRRLSATAAAVLTVSEVLVAFVLTALVYGYVVQGAAALGAAMVLVGIVLASGAAASPGGPSSTPSTQDPKSNQPNGEEKEEGGPKQEPPRPAR